MLAATNEAREDLAAPQLAAVRARISSRVPFLVERCTRLLRLAEVGATGPDPEAALYQLRAAERSLRTFLTLTREP